MHITLLTLNAIYLLLFECRLYETSIDHQIADLSEKLEQAESQISENTNYFAKLVFFPWKKKAHSSLLVFNYGVDSFTCMYCVFQILIMGPLFNLIFDLLLSKNYAHCPEMSSLVSSQLESELPITSYFKFKQKLCQLNWCSFKISSAIEFSLPNQLFLYLSTFEQQFYPTLSTQWTP